MLLAAIAVFIIDRRFVWAAGYCLFAAALASVGLIHGSKVHWPQYNEVALGYALMGAVCVGLHALRLPVRAVDPADAVDVEDRAAWGPAAVAAERGPVADVPAPVPAEVAVTT
jgi:AGZA family xanthine/uracil permease-like MFS transporter